MKRHNIKKLLLIQVLLLSTLIFIISAVPTFLFSTQNNVQESSEIIEQKNPHTSGYKIEWEENGVLICDEDESQREIGICTDMNGGAIIVWQDHRVSDGNRHIYAQRIASNGTKMWDDDGIVICNANGIGSQSTPVICSDAYYGAFIVWVDWRPGNDGTDIYVQKIDSEGNIELTPNGTVVCNATGEQLYPVICTDYEGGAWIAWQDKRNGNFDIYAQKIEDDGTMEWNNGIAICNAAGDQEAVQICPDGESGTNIAWADGRHTGYSVYVRKINNKKELKWNVNGTSICNSTFAPEYDGLFLDNNNLGICSDGDLGAFVIWIDNRTEPYSDKDVYCQRIAENGTVMWISNGTSICTELESQKDPKICLGDDECAIMVWWDERTGDELLYGQQVEQSGNTLWNVNGSLICSYTSGEKKEPQICSDGNAGAFISWRGESGSGYGYDIFVQKVDSEGNMLWTSTGINICHMYQNQGGLRMCYDGNGGIILAWKDERTDPDGDVYAQKVINVPSTPTVGGGEDDDDDGNGATEENLLPLIIIIVIIGLASTVMGVIYSYRKKKIARKKYFPIKAIEVTRGFEVAGDTFRFFVRIENTLDLALTNVSVKIIPPHTLKLDKKSPSREFLIGDVKPGKFGTAIFYLFCVACADTEINAEIDYSDPQGNLQIEKMHPFPILSCKFVKPRKISMEEFEEEYRAKDKKTVEIKLKKGISDKEAMKMIKERLTMSTVSSTSNSVAMSGKARDGSDILLKSVIKEIEGVKTAIASVVSSNQYVTMGVLSDFMETFMEFREETIDKLGILEKGHEEIKETVIRETHKILENQIAEYESLETKNLELQEEIQKLRIKFEEFELTGDFSQASGIKQQIESLSLEFRRTTQQLEVKLEEVIDNVDKIFVELGKLEDIEIYLKDHLASDWERIKTSWAELKEGKINRKQFIMVGLKVLGKRFLKVALNIAGKFI